MRHRFLLLIATAILGGAGCIGPFGENLDCAPNPIELTSGGSDRSGSIVLVDTCSRLVVVGGVRYVHQGEFVLLDEVIGRLEALGAVSHANKAWPGAFESPEDLVVWEIEGIDPGLGLWATSAALRGTNTYVLLTIDDCSEVDACEPPICDLVDLSTAAAAERCGVQQ